MIDIHPEDKSVSLIPNEVPPTINPKFAAAGYRFIRIRPVSKRAQDVGWNKGNDYAADDPNLLFWLKHHHDFEVGDSHGEGYIHYEGYGNYGLLCDTEHVVIDLDDSEIIKAFIDNQEGDAPLPKTLVGRSGSGKGMHLFYKTSGALKTVALTDPIKKTNAGHIKALGGYAVGPTSIHEKTRQPYIILEERDIAFVEFDKILKVFEKYTPKKEAYTPQTLKRLERKKFEKTSINIPITEVVYPNNPKDKGNGEIQGEHPQHGSTGGNNFSINTVKDSWHCFPAGTLIQTPDGLRNIEEIRDGENIFSSEGNTQKVTATFQRQYTGEIIDIKSPSGIVSVTPGHPILVARCPPCKKDYEPYKACKPNCPRKNKTHYCHGVGKPEIKWINSEDLNADTDFLIYQENSRNSIVYNLTDYQRSEKYRRKSPDIIELDKKLATIVGWFLAEGHISGVDGHPKKSIQFTLSHDELTTANILKTLIKEKFNLSCTIYQYPNRRTTQVFCTSTIVAKFLEKMFGTGAACKTIGSALYSDISSLKSLLKACFEGDGCISGSDRRRNYKTVSKKLAVGMQLRLLSLGKYTGRIYHHNKIYEIGFQKKIKRNYCWEEKNRHFLPISGISKRPFSGVVYNLETEDHTYQAPFIVHNCYRCGSGGSSLEWIAVEGGLIRCDEAHKGCLRGDKFIEALNLARTKGYVIDMPKRIAAEKPKILTHEPIILESLPETLPDVPITLIDAFPRLGKTHWAILQAIGHNTANIITNTHSINEQQIRIFSQHRKPGQLAVHLEGKTRSCRNSKHPCRCSQCDLYPYSDKENYMRFDTDAREVLYEIEILTNDTVPETMCPYWTIKAAEKAANFVFTVSANLAMISERHITIIDEDPTVSYFYPSSVDLAENMLSDHASSMRCFLIEKWNGVAKWKQYLEGNKRPEGKATILRIITILEQIKNALMMTKEVSTDTFNQTETIRMLNSIDTTIPDPSDITRIEVLDKIKRFEIPDTLSIFAEPLLFPYTKKFFDWQGHHPSTLRMIADEGIRIRDPPAGKMVIIGSTRAEMFVKSTGREAATIRVRTFPFSDNFVFIFVKVVGFEAYTTSTELLLQDASKVNEVYRYPSLTLVGTDKQQNRLVGVLGGIAKGSKEENRIGQQWNRKSGQMNIFYQNSVISRGIDVEFYTRLFVHATSFANPYWTAVAEVAEEEGDEELATLAYGIIDAIMADETTNSVLRISPVRRDPATVTPVELFEDKIPKVVIMNEDDLWKVKPGVLESMNVIHTTFDILGDNLKEILDQTGSMPLKGDDLIVLNMQGVTPEMGAKDIAQVVVKRLTTTSTRVIDDWKKEYRKPFLDAIEKTIIDKIEEKSLPIKDDDSGIRYRNFPSTKRIIDEVSKKSANYTTDLIQNMITDMIRSGKLREHKKDKTFTLELREIACGRAKN